MGFADRDYRQDGRRGFNLLAGSAVTILVAANVLLWLVQVAFVDSQTIDIERFLACHPVDVFRRYYLWQVLTANFLHEPKNFGHILGNMLFLYFFGRELESMYGRRDFLIFYLAAGSLAIFAEAAVGYFFANPEVNILGASGAVMGVAVLFTLFFPTRQIYLGFLIPIQAWLLCVLFVIFDLSGALGGDPGVAHWAHLTGAAFGLLYRFLDLRWERVSSEGRMFLRSIRWRLGIRRKPKILRMKEPSPRAAAPGRAPSHPGQGGRDPVSARIDEILEKISRSGRESLTSEEMEYLQRNSGRYRSER